MLTPDQVTEHAARLRERGFTVVENAIEPALAAGLRDEIRRLERALDVKPAQNLFEGTRTLRIYNLLARARVFESVPVHENVLPIVEGVLDRGLLVSSLSSIDIGPGESAQPLHADDTLIPLPKPHVSIICNTMWALTDFTDSNGATRIVPGSHKADRSPDPFSEPAESIAAEMTAGSVLIFDGSVWHAGGANRTAEPRLGLAMNYCAGYLRQQENQQLGIPLEVARRFSPRLRKLCGFGLYKKLIGHIDKCSPEDLLDGTGPRPVVGVL